MGMPWVSLSIVSKSCTQNNILVKVYLIVFYFWHLLAKFLHPKQTPTCGNNVKSFQAFNTILAANSSCPCTLILPCNTLQDLSRHLLDTWEKKRKDCFWLIIPKKKKKKTNGPWVLTQNIQERQTQVLALPTRVDGKERKTEGIVRGVPLRDLNYTQGRSLRYSQKFPPASHRNGWLKSIPDTQGGTESRGEGTQREHQCSLLSLSPSLMALVTLTVLLVSSLPWRLTVPPSTHVPSLSYSLILSLPLPSSCLCSSVVTLFCGQEKRDELRLPFFPHNSTILL